MDNKKFHILQIIPSMVHVKNQQVFRQKWLIVITLFVLCLFGKNSAFEAAAAVPTTMFEAENLTFTSSITSVIATGQTGASNDSYVQFSDLVSPAVGSWIQFTLPVAVEGTYNIKMYFKGNSSRGICEGSVDGVNMGICDQYSSSSTQQIEFDMGNKVLTTGNHTIRFTVTGKNAASSNYKLTFDYFSISEASVTDISTWKFMSGPEEENLGKANIQILSNTNGDIKLNVAGKRGHVVREITPASLPAEITFNWRSKYDPGTSEPPNELWGTGDFRISVIGMPKGYAYEEVKESNLGIMEGVQFRIHPHYTGNAIRRCTLSDNTEVDCSVNGAEPHTASSIWTRYTEPKRILGCDGKTPHTGLQSYACQNRNTITPDNNECTHNCGWARKAIVPGGFAMKNNTPAFVKITITNTEVKMYCTYMDGTEEIKRTISVPLSSSDIRFNKLSAIALGCTNTSRGYQEVEITNLKVSGVGTDVDVIKGESQLIRLFPNPVQDILTVNCLKEVTTIEVIDIMGSKKMIVNGILGQQSIDVSILSNGIYLLKAISNDNIVSTHKFVKY
jgi:hypothetical protein